MLPKWSKGSYSFCQCKYYVNKLILGDCAESLLSLRHCNSERNLRNFKKKFTLKKQFTVRERRNGQIKSNKFYFKVEISITHDISSSELLNRLLHKKHIQV